MPILGWLCLLLAGGWGGTWVVQSIVHKHEITAAIMAERKDQLAQCNVRIAEIATTLNTDAASKVSDAEAASSAVVPVSKAQIKARCQTSAVCRSGKNGGAK